MTKQQFYDLLRSVPKAELHIHEEAVISDMTIKTLYKNMTGKAMSTKALRSLFAYTDLPGFLVSFIEIQKMLQSASDIRYSLLDFQRYLRDNNIVYCETFFSPTTPLKKGFDYAEMMQILSAGIEQIQNEDGRTVRLLIDVSRSFGVENAQHNLDLLLQARCPHVIGIGLGGDEEKGPARDYQSVFDAAKAAGLHTVAHAGETCESWSMKDAIRFLHAERLGHGISAAHDAAFLRELAETQRALEVCLTSNTFTRAYVTDIKEHPVRALYDAGLLVTINTDDPTFFKVSLLDEYWKLYHVLHFGIADIKQLILNGFTAAFLSAEEKERYHAMVEEAWRQWFSAHPELQS